MHKTQMPVVTQMPKTKFAPVIMPLPVATRLTFIATEVAKTPPSVAVVSI